MFSLHNTFYVYVPWQVFPGQKSEETQDIPGARTGGAKVALFKAAEISTSFTCCGPEKFRLSVVPSQGQLKHLYTACAPSWTSKNLLIKHACDEHKKEVLTGPALADCPSFSWAGNLEWQVSVASGVDPVLMFSLVTAIDSYRDQQRENSY